MQGLYLSQVSLIEVVLSKIDRHSKGIKKKERKVNENLRRKKIFLEQENFDIQQVLRRQHEQQMQAEALHNDLSLDSSSFAESQTVYHSSVIFLSLNNRPSLQQISLSCH